MNKLSRVFQSISSVVLTTFIAFGVNAPVYAKGSTTGPFRTSVSMVSPAGGVYAPPILPGGDFTFDARVKFNQFTEDYTTAHYVFIQGDYGSGVNVSLWVNGSATLFGGTAGTVQGIVWGSSGYTYLFAGGPVITTGVWHQLSMQKNSSAVTVYLDGAQIASVSSPGVTSWTDSQGLAIGGYSTSPAIGAYSGFSDVLGGYIDEVRVSDIARYSGNFKTPMKPYGKDAHTVALYHLNNSLSDASGNGNDAQAVGLVTYVRQ